MPLLCALIVSLLFACALCDRAGATGWRGENLEGAPSRAADSTLTDAPRAGVPVAFVETRHATAVVEARVRLAGAPCPFIVPGTPPLRATSDPAPANGEAASLPPHRLLRCGYLSAPPTGPPASTPFI
ncbi:MAG TPA: hypothetical protein VF039_10660 [Longimicrobiales bacterium]